MSSPNDFKQALVKLGTVQPELRPHIRPLLAAIQEPKKAYRQPGQPYDIEGPDFAAKIWDQGERFELQLFHPIANAGRRGKMVEVESFNWFWQGRTAWGYTAKKELEKAHNAQAALQILERIQNEMKEAEPEAFVQQRSDTKQGVRVEIPSSMFIKNIDGVDIHINLNANPITVRSERLSNMLNEQNMTYYWTINPAAKKTLMALAPLLEAAKDDHAAMKILDQNGIKYDYNSYMQAGFD